MQSACPEELVGASPPCLMVMNGATVGVSAMIIRLRAAFGLGSSDLQYA
jgi:hypothetical protein